MKNGILNFWRGQISNLYSFLYLFYPRSPDTGFLSAIMPRANLKNGILNFWRGQISDSIYHFLLVGIKRGDGFHIGFQKMDFVYFMAYPSGWEIKYTKSLYYLISHGSRLFSKQAEAVKRVSGCLRGHCAAPACAVDDGTPILGESPRHASHNCRSLT